MIFSTFGQKVKWMRANPNACAEDKIENEGEWISVIVYDAYENCPSRNTCRAQACQLAASENAIIGG